MPDDPITPRPGWPQLVQKIRARTPARLLVGRAGAAYRTATQLELRRAHAAALDAVRAELDLARDLGDELVRRFALFEVCTQARGKQEYLLRPDLGRSFGPEAGGELQRRCSAGADLQIAVGDGLSVAAVAAQTPRLLPLLASGAAQLGWRLGQVFVIRHCRVGILNHIGELLHPRVAVLLIGERPGLATAESLSAYMAWRPQSAHTDADRNLISNIHARGVPLEPAAHRILNLAARLMESQTSGATIKEALPSRNCGAPELRD